MAGLLAVFAEFEREIRGERVRAGLACSTRVGLVSAWPPLGERIDVSTPGKPESRRFAERTRRSCARKSAKRCSAFYSCRKILRRELCTRISPLYSMKPNFLKRFMKKLTRDRVVPIISANTSYLTFGTTVSGLLSLPNCASSNRILASRFSLELKS